MKYELKSPEIVSLGWYVAATDECHYLRPSGEVLRETGVHTGNVGYWETYGEALEAKLKYEGKVMFKVGDIKTGMLVEMGDGLLRLCIGNTLIAHSKGGGVPMNSIKFDNSGAKSWNVMKVYTEPVYPGGSHFGADLGFWLLDKHFLEYTKCIWEYKEPVQEMTMAEVCKALGKTIKIIKG